MRDYGRVYAKFWTSDDIRELSDDGRLLALYLLTSPHGNLAGVFYLPDGYAAEDMKWTPERVAKAFEELSRNPFARRCERTKWVWVCKYLTWNPPENPNQLKAARKIAANLPAKCSWRSEFQRSFASMMGDVAPPEQKSLGTLPQGSATQEQYKDQDQDQEQYQEQKQEQDASRAPHPPSAEGNGRLNGANGKHHANGHAAPPESDEPRTFKLIKAMFPARSGSHRWADALDAYREQLKLGYTEQQMLEGVKRYAAYCKAENIEGQVSVQSARVFFGPNRGFLEPWESSKRMSAAERWMREQEAKDAQH